MFQNLIFEVAQEVFFTHVKNRNNLICADIHNMDRVRTLSRTISERISRTYSESLHPYLYDIDSLINGGFEDEDIEEMEAEITAIDEIFVPPTISKLIQKFHN